jgi:hypothetical protein
MFADSFQLRILCGSQNQQRFLPYRKQNGIHSRDGVCTKQYEFNIEK